MAKALILTLLAISLTACAGGLKKQQTIEKSPCACNEVRDYYAKHIKGV